MNLMGEKAAVAAAFAVQEERVDVSGPQVDPDSYAPEVHTPSIEKETTVYDSSESSSNFSPNESSPRQWRAMQGNAVPQPQPQLKKIAGLRRTTFSLLLASLVVIILAVTIGVGFGVTNTQNLQNQIAQLTAELAQAQRNATQLLSSTSNGNKSCPTNTTSTPSATSSAAALYPDTCTENETYQVSRTCDIFDIFCDSDWANLFWGNWLFNTTAPNLSSCIEVCDTYNYAARSRDMSTQNNMTAVIYGTNAMPANGTAAYWPGACFCASLSNPNSDPPMIKRVGVNIAIRNSNWTRTVC